MTIKHLKPKNIVDFQDDLSDVIKSRYLVYMILKIKI